MNELRVLKNRQSIQQLGREHLHQLCAEALKLVLLNELVEITGQKLKHKAQVSFVDERVTQSEDVMLIVCVVLHVQQLKDGHLHHRLVEVCRLVLDDFNRDNLMRFHVLAFDHLAKRALSQNVQDEVSGVHESLREGDVSRDPLTCGLLQFPASR